MPNKYSDQPVHLLNLARVLCPHTETMTQYRLWYKKRILGECLLISSLPGKALRSLVDIARLAEQFNMRSQSQTWLTEYQKT